MSGRTLHLPPLAKGLSARLLLLTIVFVMLAEVSIFAPSVGRFRLDYLEDRLAAAHLAILALEATPDLMVNSELERELLDHVGAQTVALTKPRTGKLMLMLVSPRMVDASFDLREGGFFGLIRDAFATLASDGSRVLRIVGDSPKQPGVEVEVVLAERPLREAMLGFAKRILALSLGISLFTAALVYLSLHLLMVRPLRQITESMARYREDPEDASRIIEPSARSDEVGVTQRELARMQAALRGALGQKARLAALGTAVSKINHDLRNILATARLVSDRLTTVEDPEVRRVASTLVNTIDRAASLCTNTLSFTREGPPELHLHDFDLAALVDDVGQSLCGPLDGKAVWNNLLSGVVEVHADREQLYRVLGNLGDNAIQAGATKVDVSATRSNGAVLIDVSDNGPGLPPRARDRLFKPFAGSTRPGGSGLGLAIAREIMHGHGGDIELLRSDEAGTCFRLTLPVEELR